MIIFDAPNYFRFIGEMAEQTMMYQGHSGLVGKERSHLLLQWFDSMIACCKELELNVCRVYVEYKKAECNRPSLTYADVSEILKGIRERFHEEASTKLFMFIPAGDARYYTDINLFGSEVAGKFPSAIYDIEEAGKCFALARYTACVFHLMRVMELGLYAVAVKLDIAEPQKIPSWHQILIKIDGEIKKPRDAKGEEWKATEPFYKGVSAQLHAVKTAWRNDTMHPAQMYDEERTLDIYNAVRGFMRYLATELSE